MRYVSGIDDAGVTIDVRDPLSEKYHARVAASRVRPARVGAALLVGNFWRRPPTQSCFVQAIETAWQRIAQHGAHQAVIDTLKS